MSGKAKKKIVVREITKMLAPPPPPKKKQPKKKNRNKAKSYGKAVMHFSATELFQVITIPANTTESASWFSMTGQKRPLAYTKLSTVYECVRFKRVQFRYVAFVGTDASGTFAMGVDYRPNETARTMEQVLAMQPNVLTGIGKNSRWITVDPRIIRPETVYSTADNQIQIKTFALVDKANSNEFKIGYVEVKYDIELSGVDIST